jgi:hypothetical protein
VIDRPQLRAGSSEPVDATQIDELLTFVPELAFQAAFEPALPDVSPGTASHAAVDQHFREDQLAAVREALHQLAQRAASEANGGVTFLVRTMLHFIDVERVPPSQHPLLVALYLRAHARANGTPDSPRAIASEMDHWS